MQCIKPKTVELHEQVRALSSSYWGSLIPVSKGGRVVMTTYTDVCVSYFLRTQDTLTSTSSTSNEKGCSDIDNGSNAASLPEIEINHANNHNFPSNYFFKGFLP
jgi:hypothetical protein